MVIDFKNAKYKTLTKIIVLSQIRMLGLTSDKTSMVTLHSPVSSGSQAVITQFQQDDGCSSTDTDCPGAFESQHEPLDPSGFFQPFY